MFGTLFQFRIAFRTFAFVCFFCGAARYTRLSINSGPFSSNVNTSPGAAPGSTTRFLLSAVNVMVGLSHVAEGSQRRSAFNPSRSARVSSGGRCVPFAGGAPLLTDIQISQIFSLARACLRPEDRFIFYESCFSADDDLLGRIFMKLDRGGNIKTDHAWR